MKVSYERTMGHSYLLLEAEDYQPSFEEEMLKSSIPGVLPMHKVCEDEQVSYAYQITQKISLTEYCRQNSLDAVLISRLLKAIISQLNHAREYLLDPDSFLIQHEYLYLGDEGTSFWLCYYIGHCCSVKDQLTSLLETWMKIIDYSSQSTVKLVYELYHQCRMDTCTYDQLLNVLEGAQKNESLISDNESVCGPDAVCNMPDAVSDYVVAPEEELEGEKEILYYPARSYLISGGSMIAMAAVWIELLRGKVFYDRSGQLDPTKLIGVFLVMAVIEVILIRKLFHKDMKLSRMVRDTELVSIHETKEASYYSSKTQTAGQYENTERETRQEPQIQQEEKEEETQLLYEEEVTQLLALPARLQLVSCLEPEKIITLDCWNTIIGSSRKKTKLYLPYPTISRIHARIWYESEEFYLEDLDSTNGTFLNQKKVVKGEKFKLKNRDKVQFAEYTYEIRISQNE